MFYLFQEIRELLAEWDVQSVNIQSGLARVSLCSPEVIPPNLSNFIVVVTRVWELDPSAATFKG